MIRRRIIYMVFAGTGMARDDLVMTTHTITGSDALARRYCGPHRPIVSLWDSTGKKHAEFHCQNERQGEFGREWDVIRKEQS